jgi:hypothetical protein
MGHLDKSLRTGEPRSRDTHTGTALRKADDRVISSAFEEVRTALGRIDTNEADILGVCRFRVAVENLPTSSGGDITQGVGRKGILMKLWSIEGWVGTRNTYYNETGPCGVLTITRIVRAGS